MTPSDDLAAARGILLGAAIVIGCVALGVLIVLMFGRALP